MAFKSTKGVFIWLTIIRGLTKSCEMQLSYLQWRMLGYSKHIRENMPEQQKMGYCTEYEQRSTPHIGVISQSYKKKGLVCRVVACGKCLDSM